MTDLSNIGWICEPRSIGERNIAEPAAKGTRRFFIMERVWVSGREKRNSEWILRLMLESVVDRVRTSTLQLDTSKERNALDWRVITWLNTNHGSFYPRPRLWIKLYPAATLTRSNVRNLSLDSSYVFYDRTPVFLFRYPYNLFPFGKISSFYPVFSFSFSGELCHRATKRQTRLAFLIERKIFAGPAPNTKGKKIPLLASPHYPRRQKLFRIS